MDSSVEFLLSEISEGTMVSRFQKDQWQIIHMNTAALQIFQLCDKAWEGKTPVEIIGPYLEPEKRVLFEETLRIGEVFLEEFYPRFGGPENIISLRSRFLELEGETLWVAVLENLAARRRLSRELYFERERNAQVLRQIREGVIIVNAAGEIQFLNRVAEVLTGWKRMEAIGESCAIVVRIQDSSSRERIACPLMKVLSTGLDIGETTTCLLVNRAGKSLQVSYLVTTLESSDGGILGAVMIFRDDTLKKQLEEEQGKSESLEVLSLLIGGVAHDLNNLFTSIQGNLALAELQEVPPDVSRRLAPIEQAVHRASNLSQQLLALSRGNAPTLQPGSLPRLIQEICSLSLAGSGVEVESGIPDDLWSCLMEEGRISRVVNNLVINARQAMNDRGKLYIRLRNETLSRNSGMPLAPGDYICLEVEDTGPGIRREYLSQVFDPYFTTKAAGTGLGLANCKALVRQHRGHIELESKLGAGALFRIFLPAAARKPVAPLVAEEEKVYHGKGRVLLMDDEKLVQQIAGDILIHLGYEPEFAQNGEEALEMVQDRKSEGMPYAVIILDLTVPGKMGGLDTKKYLENLAPEIPVIVSSGYSNDSIVNRCQEYGFASSALKPYTIKEMSLALKRAIQGQ